MIVQDSIGSGVFYHLNVILARSDGPAAPAIEVFLGDRIRFDFLRIVRAGEAEVVVGYYRHARDQAMAETPRLQVTRRWRTRDGSLVTVEP